MNMIDAIKSFAADEQHLDFLACATPPFPPGPRVLETAKR
jgi:hypothetical protein